MQNSSLRCTVVLVPPESMGGHPKCFLQSPSTFAMAAFMFLRTLLPSTSNKKLLGTSASVVLPSLRLTSDEPMPQGRSCLVCVSSASCTQIPQMRLSGAHHPPKDCFLEDILPCALSAAGFPRFPILWKNDQNLSVRDAFQKNSV